MKLKKQVKKLHIESKKKTKTVNECAALISSIREEHELIYKENQKIKRL